MNPLAYIIPPKARRIVEFGCGTGDLGAAFRHIQPECRYVGIEADEKKASEAAGVLDSVISGTVESVDLAAEGQEKLDCIIYHGEYLKTVRLAGILRAHAELLAGDGQMIFLLDNPGYFQNLLDTFRGKPPAAKGAMFPLELSEPLRLAGLEMDLPQSLRAASDKELMESDDAKALINTLMDYCRAHGQGGNADVWTRVYAVRAAKSPLPERTLIQAVLGEALVTARIRVLEPNRFCRTTPRLEVRETPLAQPVAMESAEIYPRRILLRQRVSANDFESGLSVIRGFAADGYLLIQEMDDSPTRWEESYREIRYVDFVGSHGIQVSTPALAEEMRPYNPEVRVFRNHLTELPDEKTDWGREGDPVTIFFGALNREEDWVDIMPVLNHAAERYGERIRFRVLADKGFFNVLRTPHKEYIGSDKYYNGKFVPYSVYQQTLRSADIALLPLHDTPFNRSKSDLKFIESAANGVAVLASPTVYRDTVVDGETGLIYHTPAEFGERLALLIEHREKRIDIARRAYGYVRSCRLLSQHYEERLDWYSELFARLPELGRAMEERLSRLERGDVFGKK